MKYQLLSINEGLVTGITSEAHTSGIHLDSLLFIYQLKPYWKKKTIKNQKNSNFIINCFL